MGSGDDVVQGQYNGYESTMSFAAQRPSEGNVPFNGPTVLKVGPHVGGRGDRTVLVDESVDGVWGSGFNKGAGVVGGGAFDYISGISGPGVVGLGTANGGIARWRDDVGTILQTRDTSVGVYGRGNIGTYGLGRDISSGTGKTDASGNVTISIKRRARGGAFESFSPPIDVMDAQGEKVVEQVSVAQAAQVRLVPNPHTSYEQSGEPLPPGFSAAALPKDGLSGDLLAIRSKNPPNIATDVGTTLWFCVKGVDDPTLGAGQTAVWAQVQLTNFQYGQG